jgi:hypothetical protein
MLAEIKSWFGRGTATSASQQGAAVPMFVPLREESSEVRPSTAIEEFFEGIRDQMGLTVADFSGDCTLNIPLITGLRHRMHAESIPKAVEHAFGYLEPDHPQLSHPERIEVFLNDAMRFEPASIDVVLLWDGLEWLSSEAQRAVIARLYEVMRPGASAFLIFHTEQEEASVPVRYYRLNDQRSIVVNDKGRNRPHRMFTNRSIEMMFESFRSVKFFLSRDSLREVIVHR